MFTPLESHAALLARIGGSIAIGDHTGPAVPIGTLGRLPVYGHLGPTNETVRIGRAMSHRGEIALLFGDDIAKQRRTLIVTLSPVTAVRLPITDGADLPLPLRRLRESPPGTSLLAAAMAAAQALDVDANGRRIVSALARLLDGTAARLGGDRTTAVEWGLLQVTRLLFLRFVESEGWLDGRPDFLRTAFDDCLHRKQDPGRQLFEPLFFGTLNCQPSLRSKRTRSFGSIPFLNGGLFSPHPVEVGRSVRLNRDGWIAIVELAVDGIEVSLDDHNDGRVTPDLLGRMFERVMDEKKRHGTGTFYTPIRLADDLVRETIACHLAPLLGRSESAVWRDLEDPDQALRQAVRQLTILDPACGSGVFLMAALRWQLGRDRSSGTLTRKLITRRLRGIDINPAAVRLTELRLWLEILRSMRGTPASRIRPLPNLDTTIRTGDGLLDPFTDSGVPAVVCRALAADQLAIAHLHGGTRRRALATLRRQERRALTTAIEGRCQVLRQRLDEVASISTGRDLFDSPSEQNQRNRHGVADSRSELVHLEERMRDLALAPETASFSVATAFPEQMQAGGFDLVIGNPPWVRAEQLQPRLRERLRRSYRWWQGSGKGWKHLPDLSVAFVERSHMLVKENGTVGMLLPAKLMSSSYAAVMRCSLTSGATIHRTVRLIEDQEAAFEATTYPMAMITSRRRAPAEHRIGHRLGRDPDLDSPMQQEWSRSSVWPGMGRRRERLIASICSAHPTMGERFRIGLGVKTGLNAAFLNPPAALEHWTRPALRGRDSRLGAVTRSRILWTMTADGRPLRQLPDPVAAHLEPWRTALMARRDLADGKWWRLFRTGLATAGHRVAWSDLAARLEPVIPAPDVIPLNSCYVAAATSEDEALRFALWCNSSPMRAIARASADPASGGHSRFNARVVASLPAPAALWRDPRLGVLSLESLVTKDGRERLNRLAAELLELSDDDTGLLVDDTPRR